MEGERRSQKSYKTEKRTGRPGRSRARREETPQELLDRVRRVLAERPTTQEKVVYDKARSVDGIDLIRSAHLAYEMGDDIAGF